MDRISPKELMRHGVGIGIIYEKLGMPAALLRCISVRYIILQGGYIKRKKQC